MPLDVKLVIFGVAAFICTFACADRLAKWLKPASSIGIGRQGASRSVVRQILAVAALFAICLIFSVVAWIQTGRYVLTITEFRDEDVSVTRLRAPDLRISVIIVPIPGPGKYNCNWRDATPKDAPLLVAQMTAWETQTRRLEIANFVWPQIIEVVCKPEFFVGSSVSFEPKTIERYRSYELTYRGFAIVIGGVLLWLIGVARLYFSSL